MTRKEQLIDKAILEFQNEIMQSWRKIMEYNEQVNDPETSKDDKFIMNLVIEQNQDRIETLTAVLDILTPAHEPYNNIN